MERLLKIFDLVPGWIYALAIIAILLGSATLITVEKGKLVLEEHAHAETKKSYSDYQVAVANRENERTQQAMKDQEATRELERNRSKAAQESMNVLLNETASTAAAVARADERGRVRNDLIDAASRSTNSGQGGSDPATVGRAEEAAAALGSLLKTCRAEGRSDGAEFEGLASQLRSVIAQYEALMKPKEPAP